MFVDNQNVFGNLIFTDNFAKLSKNLINRELYDYPYNKIVYLVFFF